MSHRTARFALAWAAGCLLVTAAAAQPGKPRTPLDHFRSVRELIVGGKFDLAAEELKAFLGSNPTDADLLDIQKRFGSTAFERLRTIPVWSEEPNAQAEALKTVDAVVTRAREADKNARTNPNRLRTLVYNLGATREERIFAEQELIKAGPAAVRPMIDALKISDDEAVRAGILGAITKLEAEAVPGFLAALPGLSDPLKADVLRAMAVRRDLIDLTGNADTDPRPWLWHFLSRPAGEANPLRLSSVRMLQELIGDIAKRQPDAELVTLSRRFYDHDARYLLLDKRTEKVSVWRWDADAKALTDTPMTTAEADEYFGLRQLRWAIERNPKNTDAQDLYLGLAVGRAVERTRFGPLYHDEVAAYQLMAAAPTAQLENLCERAMRAKRTAEVMGLAQGLADRADRASASPTVVTLPNGETTSKPPVLVRALDYPDPRVQLVAAIGLLRSPGPPTHGKQARVVEILRRTVASDPLPAGTTEKGRALIVDPSTQRADKIAGYLRAAGYGSERYHSGKALMRRIREAADFDVVIIDRHVANPMLTDVLAQVRADTNVAGRPVLLVASADAPRPVPLEHLILRLAVLVAATETDESVVIPPFFIDPRKPAVADLQAAKKEVADARDGQLEKIADVRLDRLRRLLRASDFPPSPALEARLALRLPQVTYAILASEFAVSVESAPRTAAQLQSYSRRLENQPNLAASTVGVPIDSIGRLIEQLETALDDARRARMDRIYRRVNLPALGLLPDADRDLALEDKLAKLAAYTPGVTVIPEPYGLVGLKTDVLTAAADPAAQPRDPAEKRLAARYAIDWLRRIGLGDVQGYDVRPAEPALREALADDEFADAAIDAMARIPTATVQEALLTTALTATRPVAVRTKAADRALVHIQSFGKNVPATLAEGLPRTIRAEKDGLLRGKLLVLHQLLSGTNDDLSTVMKLYAPPAVGPKPAAAPAEPPAPAPKDN